MNINSIWRSKKPAYRKYLCQFMKKVLPEINFKFQFTILIYKTNVSYFVLDHQVSDEDIEPSPHVSPLFEFGFFEIRVRLENKIIKANCMTCQRMGRSNLILAREFSSSNLLAHLKVGSNNNFKQQLHLLVYQQFSKKFSEEIDFSFEFSECTPQNMNDICH